MDRPDVPASTISAPPAEESTTMTFGEWLDAGHPHEAWVVVAGDDDLYAHHAALLRAPGICIRFEGFMDGRGFSHAAKLRQLGYGGTLVAGGDVLADQWVYLHRCGFDALESDATAASAGSLPGFSETYQADARESEPLFRRKHSA
ncbi:DUF934 domain-containing protein [Congregibacter sp.]|uniref:DUF934 domain-containing protein n=1 Tax=Congregibacter sp. TaxID=2744308 RepID=UPI003F6CFBC4